MAALLAVSALAVGLRCGKLCASPTHQDRQNHYVRIFENFAVLLNRNRNRSYASFEMFALLVAILRTIGPRSKRVCVLQAFHILFPFFAYFLSGMYFPFKNSLQKLARKASVLACFLQCGAEAPSTFVKISTS